MRLVEIGLVDGRVTCWYDERVLTLDTAALLLTRAGTQLWIPLGPYGTQTYQGSSLNVALAEVLT